MPKILNNGKITVNEVVIEIKAFVPSYFHKFNCIADKCPDTCCVGWEVDIDKETTEKYSTLSGELGRKIKKYLTRDELGSSFFTLCDGDRCPFLNGCGLCEIQGEMGEDFLSKTCTLFPRFFDDFGSLRETGLGFGCPEAARIILSDEEGFSLKLHEEFETEEEDVDEEFLRDLLDLRKEIFTLLEDKKNTFKKKIEDVLSLARDFQRSIDGDDFTDEAQNRSFYDCLTILEKMELISNSRKEFVQVLKEKALSKDPSVIYSSDFDKLMKYYIFRYLLKAVYDYDVLTKVKYGVFASIIIIRIYSCFENPDFDTRVKIMYSFSKEVEYSDNNMDLLDEMMYGSFSAEDLINLI